MKTPLRSRPSLGWLCAFVLLGLISSAPYANAQKIEKLEQVANGKAGTPLSEVDWVTGNVNEQKAHFAECMSIPYHLEILDLVPGTTYCVTIGYDTKRSDKHAIDFLHSWDADVIGAHSSTFGHDHDPGIMPELIDPLANTELAGMGLTEVKSTLPEPQFPGAAGFNMDPSTHYTNVVANPGLDYISIWNGTFVGAPCIASESDLTADNAVGGVKVCFTVDNNPMSNTVVLAWAGHIAASEIWGEGTSATAITGSPYHMFVAACNNDVYNAGENATCGAGEPATADGMLDGCGNKEVQLQASAVVAPADCFVTGPNPVCGNMEVVYSANLPAEEGTIQQVAWEITEMGGDKANFTSTGNNNANDNSSPFEISVTSVAAGEFTLTATITYTPAGAMGMGQNQVIMCSRVVTVEGNPVVTLVASETEACPAFESPITLTGSPVPTPEDDGDLGAFMFTPESDPAPGALSDTGPGTAVFDPEIAGPGTYIISYQYTSPTGCTGEDEVTITVFPPANVGIDGPDSVCDNDDPVMFTGLLNGSPAGGGVLAVIPSLPNGTFVGSAVTGTATLTPAPGDAGDYQIQFTYIDDNVCINIVQIPFTIYDAPEVGVTGLEELCEEDDPATYTGSIDGGSGAGGTFSVIPATAALTDNNDGTADFDPGQAGDGVYTITFTYIDGNDCEDSEDIVVTVFPTPALAISTDGEICPDDINNYELTFTGMVNGADATSGTFSIDPAPTGSFIDNGDGTATFTPDPIEDAETFTISFAYTTPADEGECSNETSTMVDLEQCCEFSAVCNLDNAIQMVEYCSYGAFLAANPFLTEITDVFTMVTDLPCGQLVMAADDVVGGDLCPDGISVIRRYFLFDDLNLNGSFDQGEMFIWCIQNYLIEDNTAPVIICPVGILGLPCDFVLDPPITDPQDFVNAGGTISEACTSLENIVISHNDVWSGTVCDGRTLTRTYTATDECGNVSESCDQFFSFLPPAEAIPVAPQLDEELTCAEAFAFTAPNATYGNGQSDDCEINGVIEPEVIPNFTKCLGGTITVNYSTTDACGRTVSLDPIIITVLPAPGPLVGEPNLPESLTCEEALAFDEEDAGLLPYTNGEAGPCLISGSLTPTVQKDIYECGRWVFVTYSGTTECGITLHTITYQIPIENAGEATPTAPELDTEITCAEAYAFSPPNATYTNGESGICEISGLIVPMVDPNFDKCGGTITVTYTTYDDCGREISIDPIEITVLPAPAPEFEALPGDITVDCIDDLEENSLPYNNGEEGDCEISGSVLSSLEEISYDGCVGEYKEVWSTTADCENPLMHMRTVYIQRVVSVGAESAGEFICQGEEEAAIAYVLAGEPGIPDEYMIDADAAAEAAGFADVAWSPLSGSPLSYAVPADVAPGVYNFVFKVRDSACPSCVAEDPFTLDVRAPDENLVCIGQVNVSLQEDCQATLDWDDVMNGSFFCLDIEDYEILVKDGDQTNGGTVDGCGKYEYVVTGPKGFTCWGYVLAEDKQAPVIKDCPSTVSGWSTTGYAWQEFVCDDIQELLFTKTITYKLDRDGNLIEGSVSSEQAEWLFENITGYATFTDNCGDLHVTVTDEVIYGEDTDCDDVQIRRTFVAKDECVGYSSEACHQYIIITKPVLEDVICPDDAELDCEDDFKLDANGNPHPDVTGYPYLYQAFDLTTTAKDGKGKALLSPTYCNLGASYRDGSRINICDGTYKFIRHWEILDWCTKEIIKCDQIIKVGDTDEPVVECIEVDYNNDGTADLRTFSTGPYDCTAAFQVPMPEVSDNCSSWEVITEIIGFSTDGPVVATIPAGASRYVSGIPLGCHFIRYTVTDECGNHTVVYCPFQVEDQVEPFAVCDDDLNVSIGGQGYARVYATDIDEGSSDNCGPIRLEVRRVVPEGFECLDKIGETVVEGGVTYTKWGDYVDFACCDMNLDVRIELRVWDDRNGDGKPGNTIEKYFCDQSSGEVTDNYNVCWMDLLIEDKLPAYCVPPLPAAIDCDELPFDFDPADTDQLGKIFGTAAGSDNCPVFTVEELPPLTEGLNDCGYGTLVRRFQVTDGKGLTSTNKCEQLVTIKEQHYYKIKFPKDAAANCGTPEVDTIEVQELGCDLLAISVKDDFFSASGDECYKIFRTYSVINWCEYDGISEPVVVSRDEDCDGKPGDEDIWVIVKTVEDPDPCYDYYGVTQAPFYSHVWYDRDDDPENLLPQAGTKGYNCEFETNPFGFWKEVYPITENESPPADTDYYPDGYFGSHCDDMASVGYWQYIQVIKVYDNVDPVISYGAFEPFCSYSSDEKAGCPAEVSIEFTVDENCTPEDLTITVYLDAGQDGSLDKEITGQLSGDYPNYTVTGSFPLGAHYLGVSVEDGCGNQIGVNIPFEVVDCKAPAPICINGLAIELMPVSPAEDVDGDGDLDGAAMDIWASDFIGSAISDCTGEVKYSINRVGEAVDAENPGLTLTCDDDASLLVEIWAWDGLGNGDFCETYVLIQDNMIQCPDGGAGAIAGMITTQELDPVEGVEVELSGNSVALMTTPIDGHYIFSGLENSFDYTITPLMDSNPLNGVSTFDLVLMSKHVLGLQSLDTPYKVLAADVNNDKRVTALDAIALRRLILNIDSKFAHNTSWRFVDAAYVFSNNLNPWTDEFPEVINVNDLQGNLPNADFVAIKVGDISLDAKVNALSVETRSKQGVFALNADNVSMTAGNEYRIEITAAQLARLQGFQGTLTFDNSKVELADLEYGKATAVNFGMHLVNDGMITTSWNGQAENKEVLFTLIFRAKTEVELSEVLSINSRITVAEAYGANDELMDLAIDFGQGEVVSAGFELGQNSPNPFRIQTMIHYTLPEAGEVTFRITDAAGQLVQILRTSGVQGKNALRLERSDLPAGVLFYTLTTDDFTATRSMVVE